MSPLATTYVNFSNPLSGTHCEHSLQLSTTTGNDGRKRSVWPGHHTRALELMETQFSLLTVPARQFPPSLHYEVRRTLRQQPVQHLPHKKLTINYLSALGTYRGPFGFCLLFLFLLSVL